MDVSKDAGRVIGMVSNQIKCDLNHTVLNEVMTGMQGRFLHFILTHSTNRDLFQKDLEEEFNLRRYTATGILQLMEKNDLLYRKSVDYDAKLKKIVVTQKGTQCKAQVEESIRELEKRLQKDISETDLATFFRVMKQRSKNLE